METKKELQRMNIKTGRTNGVNWVRLSVKDDEWHTIFLNNLVEENGFKILTDDSGKIKAKYDKQQDKWQVLIGGQRYELSRNDWGWAWYKESTSIPLDEMGIPIIEEAEKSKTDDINDDDVFDATETNDLPW